LFHHPLFKDYEPRLSCNDYLEARAALENEGLAAFLPDFLKLGGGAQAFFRVQVAALDSEVFQYRLAWNPRLLRLNPRASRWRDFLIQALAARMRRPQAGCRLDWTGEAVKLPSVKVRQ
jgi:hypothetical protein